MYVIYLEMKYIFITEYNLYTGTPYIEQLKLFTQNSFLLAFSLLLQLFMAITSLH